MDINYNDIEVGNEMPVYSSAPITRTDLSVMPGLPVILIRFTMIKLSLN